MLLEKTTRMNFLFDFYQALLTDKQRSYMELYYLDDHSLGEIAESYGVSRQAVYETMFSGKISTTYANACAPYSWNYRKKYAG